MRAKFLSFIIAFLLVNALWGQRINVNVRVTRLYTPYNGDIRWNVWVDGATNKDDGGAYPCFAISGSAGWNSQFVNRTMPYYIYGTEGKVYNLVNNQLTLSATVEGYHKNCFYTGGSSNGSYCDYKSTCYGNSGLKNGDNDDGYKIGDFNIVINSNTIPGVWIKETGSNGIYQVEYEYQITPITPTPVAYSTSLSPSPGGFIIGNINVCGGEIFYLTTSSASSGGDYVWQENTNYASDASGIIWNEIPGENLATLKVISPSNVAIGDTLKKMYRVFKRNNNVLSLDPADVEYPIFIYPPKPNIENSNNYISITHVKCKGQSSGKVKVQKVDGAGNYKYTLFKAKGTGFPILNSLLEKPLFPDDAYNKPSGMVGLPVGEYVLVVKNNFTGNGGCQDTIHFTITEPEQLTLSTPVNAIYNGGVNVSCNGGSDGSITLNAAGGVAPYTYSLAKDPLLTSPQVSGSGIFSGLSASNYYFNVRDVNGCITTNQSTTLVEPTVLKASVLSTNIKCNGSNDGVITFNNVSGGTIPYFYSIDNKQNFLPKTIFNSLAPAAYVCNMKDANGCNINDVAVVIIEPAKLEVASKNIHDVNCFGGSDGSFSVSGEGGTGIYKYSFNGGSFQTSSDFSNLQSGTYNVKISDDNNCIKSLNVYLSQPEKLKIDFNVTQVQCTGFDNGLIKAAVTGGVMPYAFEWTGQNDSDSLIDQLSPGEYNLVITDSHNCVLQNSAIVTEPANELSADIKKKIDSKCNIVCNGEIELEANGGTPPYTYVWNDDNNLNAPGIINLCQGAYDVKIKDSRECIAQYHFDLKDSVQFNLHIPDSIILCPGKYANLNAGNPDCAFDWTSSNGLVNNSQILSTNLDGLYQLKVTKPNGCYEIKDFKIRTSKDLLKAQFLLPSYVAIGDTVVFVEVSNPMPDSVRWNFEGSPEILNYDKGSPELYFDKEGMYNIKLTSYLGDCIDSISKSITFFIPPDDTSNGDALGLGLNRIKSIQLYPNPNSGLFKLEVGLDQSQNMDYEVLNSQGNSIHKGTDFGRDTYLENINLNLRTGVYLLKIQTATDFKTVMFIVN